MLIFRAIIVVGHLAASLVFVRCVIFRDVDYHSKVVNLYYDACRCVVEIAQHKYNPMTTIKWLMSCELLYDLRAEASECWKWIGKCLRHYWTVEHAFVICVSTQIIWKRNVWSKFSTHLQLLTPFRFHYSILAVLTPCTTAVEVNIYCIVISWHWIKRLWLPAICVAVACEILICVCK